jgi:hypothetical protein
MRIQVLALNADFGKPVPLGDLTVDDGQLICRKGEGTLSGVVPCERLRSLLSHRFGAFLGQPFALKYGGVLVSDCFLISSNAAETKFVYVAVPPHEEIARAMLAK